MFTFKHNANELEKVSKLFEESPRVADIRRFRLLCGQVGHVKNLFIGDSITSVWPLHEFFPAYSILNRGVGSDNVYGINSRLNNDVFPYKPERVFMLVGINGISEETDVIVNNIGSLAEAIKRNGSSVFISSILPLREAEGNVRFCYQDKIVGINRQLKSLAADNGFGFLDYHSELKDDRGQLDVRYACEDGLHLAFEGYRKISQLVFPHLVKGI